MTIAIIITFCALLLIAYFFDVSSTKTRIPAVILLLAMGFAIRQLTEFFYIIKIPDFSSILPVFGTIGLVLIVLEAALELELNKSKFAMIRKSLIGALLPMLAIAFLFTWVFQYFGGYSFRSSLLNAVPISVISSAIAIPSVRNLTAVNREFLVYESSFSDILGVVFFNFVLLNQTYGVNSFAEFGLQVLIIMAITFIATLGLSFLLHRIEHHIKFMPIILLIILIFALAEIWHLPALIFILLFGLFIGNLNKLKRFKWIGKMHPGELHQEGLKFKEITTEGAFLVKSLFFLLFGFSLQTAEILNLDTLIWSISIVIVIYLLRAIQLKISGLKVKPLLFVAPRGLITILLFLSIEAADSIGIVNKSLIIQVIVLTALVMMFGLMGGDNKEKKAFDPLIPDKEELED